MPIIFNHWFLTSSQTSNLNCIFFILGSETVTLTKPQILKQQSKQSSDSQECEKEDFPVKTLQNKQTKELSDALVQTLPIEISKSYKLVQTDINSDAMNEMRGQVELLKVEINKKTNQLHEAMTLAHKRTEEILVLNIEKATFESTLQNLKASISQKDIINEKLQYTVDNLTKQLNDIQMKQITETNQKKDTVNEENNTLLLALKQLENDKNAIMVEYKELLRNERDEYAKSVKEMQVKIMELQSTLDR